MKRKIQHSKRTFTHFLSRPEGAGFNALIPILFFIRFRGIGYGYLLGFSVLFSCEVRGQEKQPLEKTLKALQQRYNFFFSYDVKYALQPVDVLRSEALPIEEQLNHVFKNSTLTYRQIASKVYVIRPLSAVATPLKRFITHRQNKQIDTLTIGQTHLLDEIEVSSARMDSLAYHLLIDRIPLSKAHLIPGVFGKDVFNSLQYTAGVSSVVEPATGLYVRGGTPDQSLLLLDGICIFNADHPLAMHSFINADLLSKIDFQKAYTSPRLGGRTASFVEISTKSYGQIKDRVAIELGLWGAESTVEQHVSKRISMQLSFRHQWPTYRVKQLAGQLVTQRNLIPNGLPTSVYNSKVRYHDFMVSLNYQLRNNSQLKTTFYYSDDRYTLNQDSSSYQSLVRSDTLYMLTNNLVTSLTPMLNHWQNRGYSLQYIKSWNSHNLTRLTMSRSRSNQQSIIRTNLGNTIEVPVYVTNDNYQQNDNRIGGFMMDNTYTGSRVEWSWGGQVTLYSNSYLTDSPQLVLVNGTLLNNYKNHYSNFSAYAEATWFLRRGTLKTGFRASEWGNGLKIMGEPRLQLEQQWGHWHGQLYYTRHHQAFKKLSSISIPTAFNGYWYLSDGVAVPITQTNMLGGGLQFVRNKMTASGQVYHKLIQNISELGAKYQLLPTVMLENGEGKSTGVELTLMKELPKGMARIDYTYNDTKYRFPTFSANTFFKAPYLPQHEIKAIGIHHTQQLSLSAIWIVGFGRPYALQQVVESANRILNPLDYNQLSLKPYHRLDLSATYNWKKQGFVNLSIQNAYNHANEWYKVVLDSGPNPKVGTRYQPGILINIKTGYAF